jgi:hypothetical protein
MEQVGCKKHQSDANSCRAISHYRSHPKPAARSFGELARHQAQQETIEGLSGEGCTQGRAEEGKEKETVLMIETDMLYAHIKTND